MSVSEKLTGEIIGISILVIIIVVMSIVLNKFKEVDGVTASLNTSIDTTTAAIDEPITWITIIVIIIVVAWLVVYLKSKSKEMA